LSPIRTEKLIALVDAKLVRVAAEPLLERQRCVAGALTMILVRDRGEETIHDPVPLFGIDLLGEAHRTLHVAKEHRHLFPLPFESATGGQDLLGKVLRGVGARIWRLDSGGGLLSEAVAARVTEAILR
jgi:hypothetical protein